MPDPLFLAENTERKFVAHNVATFGEPWDGSHPPPATEAPETCGCDEAKAWRERALVAESRLRSLGAVEETDREEVV